MTSNKGAILGPIGRKITSHKASTFLENYEADCEECESILHRENRRGGSTVNRGHAHHRSIRPCRVREGRPRRFGGAQRDSGTGNASSSCIVQLWSVIPAALAGVV